MRPAADSIATEALRALHASELSLDLSILGLLLTCP